MTKRVLEGMEWRIIDPADKGKSRIAPTKGSVASGGPVEEAQADTWQIGTECDAMSQFLTLGPCFYR